MFDRRDRPGQPWHLYILGLLAAGVVAFAITQIGPPTSSARTSTETVTAEDGVVQTTVSGTGNVEAGTDVDANFQTSGTLSTVLVHVGEHVTEGQLLATLDPTEAQLAVDQAEENLTAAQDQLTTLEDGGTTTGSTSTGTGSATSASTTVSAGTSEFVSASVAAVKPKRKPGKTGTTPTRTTTTPTTTAPRTTTTPSSSTGSGNPSSGTSSGNRTGGGTTTTNTTTTSTPSPGSIASAQANVDSAESNLRTAEDALNKLQLHAPATGTIISMAGLAIGDTVSAGSSGAASSGAASSGTGGSGSTGSSGGGSGAGGSTTAGGLGSSSSTSSSSSASTPFAEIVDTSTMTMTVAFSESDITSVKVGQPATITMDALSGVELAAHVSSISTVGSTSSGVVSYDATLTLDQLDPRVKPGMSASASVITGQADGVTVPTQAITGTGSLATVNVKNGNKTVPQQVVVGLRGSSRVQIVSGLKAGQQVVITITLPSLSSSSSTTGAGGLGSRLGGGGLSGLGGGGLGGGGFGGGGAFFRRAAGG